MRKAYIAGDNIISSLGFTTPDNIRSILENRIGLKISDDRSLTQGPVPLSMVENTILDEKFLNLCAGKDFPNPLHEFTKLEKMFILSIHDALEGTGVDPSDDRALLIISTTKGNIDLLVKEKGELFDPSRVYLWKLAEVIMDFFGFANFPVIVSSACISGVLGIGAGYRYIRSGKFDHAVVTGGDILSQFVVSGFQSFQSLSPGPCRPYDISRDGLSLGEASGTVVLTTDPSLVTGKKLIVMGTSTSNDANHISGPSRTGEELAMAVTKSMNEAGLKASSIGYISAHGTATPYNDEMESKAFSLAGLSDVPLNSFKGYWGHTLGAAGVIETVAAIHSLKQGILFRSAGFTEIGVPEKINVLDRNTECDFEILVKTASGFGGCNASLVIGKDT